MLAIVTMLALPACGPLSGGPVASFRAAGELRPGDNVMIAGEDVPVVISAHYLAASGEECVRYEADEAVLACRQRGATDDFRAAGPDMTGSAMMRQAVPDHTGFSSYLPPRPLSLTPEPDLPSDAADVPAEEKMIVSQLLVRDRLARRTPSLLPAEVWP